MDDQINKKIIDNDEYSPYCPICDSCGEDGCCPATSCKHHPDGRYCETYLNELKFGYMMYHDLMEIIDEDDKYSDEVDKIWDKNYDMVFLKKQKIKNEKIRCKNKKKTAW